MKLVKDSIWNLLSIGIPAVLAIPVFSMISKTVGLEIFGIYMLSLVVIGYASIFDFGIGRAVIREVAMNTGKQTVLEQIINTAGSVIAVLSVVAFLITFFASSILVDVLHVSAGIGDDVKHGFRWLALGLPPLLISQVWLAYFEGLSEFRALSIVKTLSSVLIVVLPLLAAWVDVSFTALMVGMVIARLLTALMGYIWIRQHIRLCFTINRVYLKSLLGFGGWLTVSAVIGPTMVYFDRFILSSMFGTKNIAFYTVPSELVMRLLSLPGAGVRTLFARFSRKQTADECLIYRLSLIFFALAACLLVAPLFILAKPILILWMGQGFTGEPVMILRILLIGFIFNTIAQVPFTSLQAKGLSKQTALVHCTEVIPYLLALYLLINSYGMIGAAIAWSLRGLVDMLVFLQIDISYRD